MKTSRIHPRAEQVAELTRGQELPTPALDDIHLEIIADVLIETWRDLAATHPAIVNSGLEAEITTLVESALVRRLDEDPLWEQMVRCVARGKETISFDGAHLEKRPDLSIYLTRRSHAFPLVIECKIIDRHSGKHVDLYCEDGVLRFIIGEYAWATSEAFMLAYVRDGSQPLDTLVPLLHEAQSSQPDRFATLRLVEPTNAAILIRTIHNRTFRYVHVPSGHPGPIAIWHLWLSTINDRR